MMWTLLDPSWLCGQWLTHATAACTEWKKQPPNCQPGNSSIHSAVDQARTQKVILLMWFCVVGSTCCVESASPHCTFTSKHLLKSLTTAGHDELVLYVFTAWLPGHDAGTCSQMMTGHVQPVYSAVVKSASNSRNAWVCHYIQTFTLVPKIDFYKLCFLLSGNFVMAHAWTDQPACVSEGGSVWVWPLHVATTSKWPECQFRVR